MTPKEIRGLATRLENTGWRAEAPYLREESEKAAKALNAMADLVDQLSLYDDGVRKFVGVKLSGRLDVIQHQPLIEALTAIEEL